MKVLTLLAGAAALAFVGRADAQRLRPPVAAGAAPGTRPHAAVAQADAPRPGAKGAVRGSGVREPPAAARPVPALKGQQATRVRAGAGVSCIAAGGFCMKGTGQVRCCDGLVGTGNLHNSYCTADADGETCEEVEVPVPTTTVPTVPVTIPDYTVPTWCGSNNDCTDGEFCCIIGFMSHASCVVGGRSGGWMKCLD